MRFLLIDKIVKFETGVRLLALKNVSMSEDIFTDHFPTFPVLPGAFIIDAFEQAATLCIGATIGFVDLLGLTHVRNGKFRRFVRPGDQIMVEAAIAHLDEKSARMLCSGKVDGREVARAELEFTRINDPSSQHPFRLKGLFHQLTSLS